MTGFVQAAVFLLLLCRMEAPAVSGRVLKADGSPAPQVWVHLSGVNGLLFPRSAHTGGDGRYRLDALPTGLQTFEAQDDALGKGEREIEIGPGENHLDITLSEELVARGRVVDPDGKPVAGAQVEEGSTSVQTDAQGSFAILVDEDRYELVATKAGYSPAYLSHWAARGSREGLELRLGHEASVSGRILGFDPVKIDKTEVLATSLLHSGIRIPGQVSSDGAYRIPGLAPGEWFLSAELDERSVTATVTITPEEPEIVQDLSFLRTEVRGRVVDAAGEPADEIGVGLIGPDEKYWATTGPDGTFSVEVPDGTYEILAFQEEVAATRGGVVTVAGEPVEGLEIRLERTAVLAVRLLGISEEDLDSFQIQIELGSFRTYATERETAKHSGEPPVYVFDDFEPGPGDWTLRARVNAEEVVGQVKIRPGDQKVEVDLPFTFGDLTLSCRITGYRIPNRGSVWLQKVGDRSFWREEVDEGTFVYSRLRPGRYLLIFADGRTTTEVRREVDLTSSQEIEIDLGSPD